ncbi:hypothetical protein MPSEU_000975500 [Mayamaea pseudoterrestris]|nr:hypothetical protein MPSEU_000975500 [Mayamaea pseudoterrestris]
MLRYHLPKWRRPHIGPESKNAYIGLGDPSEETLSVRVQHAASRDEVETLTASTPDDKSEIRDHAVADEDAASPISVAKHTTIVKSAKVEQKGILRRFRKLRGGLPKGTTNNEAMLEIPIKTTLAETDSMTPIPPPKPAVLVAGSQGSISTLSYTETVRPSTALNEIVPHTTAALAQQPVEDIETEEFDLSFDEMSFSNSQTKGKDPPQPAETLISRQKASTNAAPTDIWSACRVGDEGFIRGALAHNRAILMQAQQGRTPLYIAAHAGQAHAVKLLLEWGAKDLDGTAYLSALNSECRKLLADAKCIEQTAEEADHPRDRITVVQGDESWLQEYISPTVASVSTDPKQLTAVNYLSKSPPPAQLKDLHKSSLCVASSTNALEKVVHSYQSFGLDHGTTSSGEMLGTATDSMSCIGDDESTDMDSTAEMLSHTDFHSEECSENSQSLTSEDEEESASSTSSVSESLETASDGGPSTVETSPTDADELSGSPDHHFGDPYSCDWHLGICKRE